MKSHVSATISKELLDALHEIRRSERRSLSNLLEIAVAEFIERHQATDEIVTSAGRFKGRFSREDTYAPRDRTGR